MRGDRLRAVGGGHEVFGRNDDQLLLQKELQPIRRVCGSRRPARTSRGHAGSAWHAAAAHAATYAAHTAASAAATCETAALMASSAARAICSAQHAARLHRS